MPTSPATATSSCLLAACLTLAACHRPAYGEFNQSPSDHRIAAASARENTATATVGTTDSGAVEEAEFVQVPTLTRETDPAPPAEYTIGPRDELMIEVAPHESAGVSVGAGASAPSASMGTGSRTGNTVVHDDGTIQLLGVGTFHAAGRTITQLSEDLKKEYAKVINNPEVLIEIRSYKSQIAYLSGQFGKPGPMFLDHRTDMLQLISLAGNPSPNANLRGAYVMRKDKGDKYRMLNVDLYSLLEEGDISQNIWIHPNDFLYIPDNSKQVVYFLGNIGRPGPMQMKPDGTLSLQVAVAMAGGVRSFGTDWNRFRIIRSLTPTRGEFIVVNYQKILDGEAADFQLRAGDVVYIANSRLGDWNEALGAISPSFGLIGQAMTPFVQMKVLQQTFK